MFYIFKGGSRELGKGNREQGGRRKEVEPEPFREHPQGVPDNSHQFRNPCAGQAGTSPIPCESENIEAKWLVPIPYESEEVKMEWPVSTPYESEEEWLVSTPYKDPSSQAHLIHHFLVTPATNTNVFCTDRCGLSPLGLVATLAGSSTLPQRGRLMDKPTALFHLSDKARRGRRGSRCASYGQQSYPR